MSGVCPICGKAAAPRVTNASAPFCTVRCKQVDLGKWLREEYRIPTDDDASTSNHPPDGTSNEQRNLAAGNRKEPPS